MKIVIVGTAYPLRGGISHYNALLYQELRKRHDVGIVTFKRQYPSLLFPGKTQVETEGELLRVPSEALVDSINPQNWVSVGRILRARNPDLIIFKYWLPFFGPCFGTIGRTAKRNSKVKVLFICDNVVPHEKRPGDRAFTSYAFKPADYFIVQSDAVEQDLLRFWPDAVYRKVPHPVYNIFGEPLEKREARRELGITADHVLLFFGYVRKYKGLHVLLQAMEKLVRSRHIHLMVVGEFYDEQEKYRQQINNLDLNDHVTVISDYVPNDQVRLYFSASDLVVLPYISATQSGIAQIAYNFNTPVVASSVGGLGEVVRDEVTGFLVPPDNADALAEAIIRFYDGNRHDEFVKNVLEEKKKYTWEAMVRAIEELASQ